MSSSSEFTVSVAGPADIEAFIELSRRCFNRDEPLNESISLTSSDGHCSELESYIVSSLDEGTSVKAEVEGKLVAFSANGIIERGSVGTEERSSNVKFQKILDFLDYNMKKLDLFTRYSHVNKIMNVKIISVDPIMRGRGVATKLSDRTRQIAREQGCQMMLSECSSFYSALVFKKLGFKEIYRLNYSDYEVDGKVVFTPAHPHTVFTVYVQEL